MTEKEKKLIKELRHNGYGYKAIADKLNISANAISSFCRRNNLHSNTGNNSICKECGKNIVANKKTKKRIFCSVKCSTTWWNNHRELKQKRKPFTFTCLGCGAETKSYGNHNRKYCSHKCYLKTRYDKGGDLGE